MGATFRRNPALGRELANQFGGMIEQSGFVAERETKRRTPVRTGWLRNGFATDIERIGSVVRVTVANVVGYAAYVEFGTSKMRGVHMLANGTQAAARWLAARGWHIDYDVKKGR